MVKENPSNGQLDLHIKVLHPHLHSLQGSYSGLHPQELELMMTHDGLNVKLDNLLGGKPFYN